MQKFGIAIHGGAGTILKSEMTEEKEIAYTAALQSAVDIGFQILKDGGTSMEAVTQAIIDLENCPLFNAGKGSVFNAVGKHEMDASIMDGKSLNGGAIAAVENLKNPILLAKKVLDFSDHVLLIGEGAKQFAEAFKDIEFETDTYFHDAYRFEQWQKIKGTDQFQLDHSKEKKYYGTVGAVALDQHGDLASGTSTGGMTNKKFGRVGDSPIVGAGTYADNHFAAVSCTGSGEYIMRAVSAYDVIAKMRYKNVSLEEAANEAIHQNLSSIKGDGGLIAIDKNGNISMPFNSEGMYRAMRTSNENIVRIYKA
ncbi:MAG: isoaspartyl peptidase/L-asparaginase [Bacteroidota bacterium]